MKMAECVKVKSGLAGNFFLVSFETSLLELHLLRPLFRFPVVQFRR